MALNVKDIMDLPSGQKMRLVAGRKGLERAVVSVEIADYEFAPDVRFAPSADFDLEQDMEADSFIITSFLFAKDDPALILPAVERMERMGMAGLAFKQIIYEELPAEVLDYADAHGFPVFSFGKTVWFENIIFDIMYAVQFDDRVYLSEEKIASILSGHMSRAEMDVIRKGISLKLRPFVAAAYFPGGEVGGSASGVASEAGGEGAEDLASEAGTVGPVLDAGRAQRSFYLSKGLRDKALAVRYRTGLLVITTSQLDDIESHRLILRQVMDAAGLDPAFRPGLSEVHPSVELDEAIRESWYCSIAIRAEMLGTRVPGEGPSGMVPAFDCYGNSGIYQFLIPAINRPETIRFAGSLLDRLQGKSELLETAEAFSDMDGDITATAEVLFCHANTVRYRLVRIRELLGLAGSTDPELFMHLKLAVSITRAVRAESQLEVWRNDEF